MAIQQNGHVDWRAHLWGWQVTLPGCLMLGGFCLLLWPNLRLYKLFSNVPVHLMVSHPKAVSAALRPRPIRMLVRTPTQRTAPLPSQVQTSRSYTHGPWDW